ncbi:hypothetical protein ES332_D12G117400v1 [Gossypium tomentosum]|uniref:Uncharacterized protein n=1 Tax=Gossypium tomentosum TaxID=34277 RepID=A0A5D2I7H0_GOSTO|nr:hypothetical protein ES332_D12G117400v1 [Gossypium tomentosum]
MLHNLARRYRQGILRNLCEVLLKACLMALRDFLIWVHDNKGDFSVKKLTNLLIEGERDDVNFAFDKIWKLKVHSRVRNFLWMLAINRVPIKDFLMKRGERVDHLFFKCNFIVEVGWKMVSCFEKFYTLCFNVKLHGTSKSLWLIAIAASCWSVWLARNEMVFERKVLSMDTLIFHSKMRALLWIRVVFNECMVQERLWWLSPSKCRGLATEEAMGCGGVLRDEEGNVRALFSRPSIITSLDVIIEIGWRGIGLTIVEIGSLVAYNWLLNKDRRPWSQQTTFADMEMRLAYVGEVAFSKAE